MDANPNPYAAPVASLDTVSGAGAARVGFWLRVAATVIDAVVVWVVAFVLRDVVTSLIPGYLAESAARTKASMDPNVNIPEPMIKALDVMNRWAAAAGIVSVIYALAEILLARTPGKLLLGLRIAREDGRPATLGRLALRFVIKQSGGLLMLAGMLAGTYLLTRIAIAPSLAIVVGFFFVLAARRQSLHDWVSKTAVYRNSDVVAGSR